MIDAINICLPSNNYISIEMRITDPSVRLVFRCTFSCFVIWKNQWSVLFCLLLIFQVYFLFQLYWGIINIGDLFETFTQHKKNDLVADLFQESQMSPPNPRILPALASWPHLFPHLGAHCSQDLLLLALPRCQLLRACPLDLGELVWAALWWGRNSRPCPEGELNLMGTTGRHPMSLEMRE